MDVLTTDCTAVVQSAMFVRVAPPYFEVLLVSDVWRIYPCCVRTYGVIDVLYLFQPQPVVHQAESCRGRLGCRVVYYTEICYDCFRTRAGGKQDAASSVESLGRFKFSWLNQSLLLVFIYLFAVMLSMILLHYRQLDEAS